MFGYFMPSTLLLATSLSLKETGKNNSAECLLIFLDGNQHVYLPLNETGENKHCVKT